MRPIDKFFPAGEEFTVTNDTGVVPVVVSPVHTIPLAVQKWCEPGPGLLRIAGSTTGLKNQWQVNLLEFVLETFGQGAQYLRPNTVVMSGGWRVRTQEGRVAVSVLEVPQLVKRLNPRSRTLGSLPLTSEAMCFYGSYSTFAPLAMPGPEVQPNPGNDLLWAIQGNGPLNWQGDIPAYVALMDRLKAEGKATGLLVFGGGGVTADEIRIALQHRHPVAIVTEFGGIGRDLVRSSRGDASIDPQTENTLAGWRDMNFEPQGFDAIGSTHECVSWLDQHGFLTGE